MAVVAHAQQYEIKARRGGIIAKIRMKNRAVITCRLLRTNIGFHNKNMVPGNGHMIEQRVKSHARIVSVIVKRDIAFITPKNVKLLPINATAVSWRGK